MESYAIAERQMIESWENAQDLLVEIRKVTGAENPTPVDWEKYRNHVADQIAKRKRQERLARQTSKNPQPRTGYRKRRFRI